MCVFLKNKLVYLNFELKIFFLKKSEKKNPKNSLLPTKGTQTKRLKNKKRHVRKDVNSLRHTILGLSKPNGNGAISGSVQPQF